MTDKNPNDLLLADLTKLSPDFQPIVYKFPKLNEDIFNFSNDVTFSNDVAYPQFSLGFQHYYHQSKDKMELTEQFEQKKKVYLVFNKFERFIDDYPNDLANLSKSYFEINKKPDILAGSFYKLWEALLMFNLIDVDQKDFISAHLADGTGSFLQATVLFREKFSKRNIETDKYFIVTLSPDETKEKVPPIDENFFKYYSKERPQQILLHRNVEETNKQSKVVKLFEKDFGTKKADFITADGGFNSENENIQEQESFKKLLTVLVAAIKIQKEGGNLFLRLFESFTAVTAKILCIFNTFYQDVYIYKPLTSRQSSSEKFIVGLNFKYSSKDKKLQEYSKKLDEMFNDILSEKKNVVQLFPDYELSPKFKALVTNMNTEIANKQFKKINEMVDFINRQNYRGEEYQRRRDMQIEATKYWIELFFPEKDNIKNNLTALKKLKDQIFEKNQNKINKTINE